MYLTILFSKNPPLYYAGENVQGTLLIKSQEALNARQVLIKIHGEARNSWSKTTESDSTNSDGSTSTTRDTTYYDSTIEILSGESRVWGVCVGKSEIPAGELRLDFSFNLPPNCLSTFHSFDGKILYSVKAEVDTGRWNFNKTTASEFTVVKPSDLSLNPKLLATHRAEKSHNIGIPLFRKGNVTLTATISKIGFVTNETLNINLIVNNESKRKVDMLKISLEGTQELLAFEFGKKQYSIEDGFQNEKAQFDERKIFSKHHGKMKCAINVQPHCTESLVIPFEIPCVPSSFECAISRLFYVLNVSIRSKETLNSSTSCQLPIVIGDIGFEKVGEYDPPPVYAENPKMKPAS
ncbi:unnamed protein product, partial [Mesorhabditis belari]|uniref:Arrestin C-terminal-like domain-containing protein n=1 Tax=Mesorhabditis belari TaxID=2138241 RepID=A0AAF3J3R9_9BILA